MRRLVAILACHNRREQTVECLASLFAQNLAGYAIGAVLLDDGSTDGTMEAVRALSERVELIQGDGSFYWARAMAISERRASDLVPDYLLWLNDDVVLFPDALSILLGATNPPKDDRIVVGSVIDPATRSVSYGGLRRRDSHPLRYELVTEVDGTTRPVETFNGNVVLVPKAVYRTVGGIDGAFSHAYADLDYGLRARALGFDVVVAGSSVGTCARGSRLGTWRDPSLPLRMRYRLIFGPKGVPISSSLRYYRRHGGRLWPAFFLGTYVKLAFDHLRVTLRTRIALS
jgi:GT2 family glycosyltransferase